jgi:Glycosyltransferase family 25 (LPS biosynthesis protein)
MTENNSLQVALETHDKIYLSIPPRSIAPHEWIQKACEQCILDPNSRVKHAEWNWLPRAFCITLATRPERRKQAEKEFHRVGLCAKMIYYSTQKDYISGMRGCWESHRSIAKKCIEDEADWYLVFEDDVVFKTNFTQHHVNKIESCLKEISYSTPLWKMLYLGGLPKSLWFSPTKDYASFRGWTSHAVLVSKEMARIVVENSFEAYNHPFQEKRIEIDGFMLKFEHSYVVFPPLAFTADHGISDLNDERPAVLKKLQQLKNRVEESGKFFIEEVYIWLLAILPWAIGLFILAILVVMFILFIRWMKVPLKINQTV